MLFAPRLTLDNAVWNGEKELSSFKVFNILEAILGMCRYTPILLNISLNLDRTRTRSIFSSMLMSLHRFSDVNLVSMESPFSFSYTERTTDSGNYSKPASFEVCDV